MYRCVLEVTPASLRTNEQRSPSPTFIHPASLRVPRLWESSDHGCIRRGHGARAAMIALLRRMSAGRGRCGGMGRSAAALLAAVALLMISLSASVDAVCKLRLQLEPGNSTLQLSASNALITSTTRTTSPITWAPNVSRAFEGSLILHSPARPSCPTTLAEWRYALPQFTVSTANGAPLRMRPALMLGRTVLGGRGWVRLCGLTYRNRTV